MLRIAVTAAAVYVAVAVVDGLTFEGTWTALAAIALILAAVNALIKPVVKLFSLPFIILSLGLFLLVINALMLWITIRLSDELELGLTSDGFGSTLFGAFVISLITWALQGLYERE